MEYLALEADDSSLVHCWIVGRCCVANIDEQTVVGYFEGSKIYTRSEMHLDAGAEFLSSFKKC